MTATENAKESSDKEVIVNDTLLVKSSFLKYWIESMLLAFRTQQQIP